MPYTITVRETLLYLHLLSDISRALLSLETTTRTHSYLYPLVQGDTLVGDN